MKPNFFYRLIVVFVLLTDSCFCPESDLDYIKISGIELQTHYEGIDSKMPSIYIGYTDYNYVASHWNLDFMNSNLYATSCKNTGIKGLKPTIDSLIVTSNKIYNNVPVGESINEFTTGIFTGAIDGAQTDKEMETSDLPYYLNNSIYVYDINSKIIILQVPMERGIHVLTITFYMDDGTILKANTDEMNFN